MQFFAKISWLLCVLYQTALLLRPVGVVAEQYDWLYVSIMETENVMIRHCKNSDTRTMIKYWR